MEEPKQILENRDERLMNWIIGLSVGCAFIWIIAGMKLVEIAQQFIKIFGD